MKAFLGSLCLVIAFPAVTAWAAVTEKVVWNNGVRVVFQGSQVEVDDPSLKAEPLRVDLPTGTLWASWRPGGIYALVPGKEEDGPQVLLLPKGGRQWQVYARLPGNIGDVRAAIPMQDGRLFLVPNGAFLNLPDESQWAPFLIAGRDATGKWSRLEPVFLDWGPPFREWLGNDGKPHWRRATRRYTFLSTAAIEAPDLGDRLFELESGWAFLDRHHGLMWVFDAEGSLKRRISIYGDLKDSDLDLPIQACPIAILACETAPGGRLILAARNETAFFFSRKVWPVNLDPTASPEQSAYQLREAQAAKDFPNITWMMVNTEKGEVIPMSAPPDLPSHYVFHPENPDWHFHFKVNSGGQASPE